MRVITIVTHDNGSFDVHEGECVAATLCWDEMLACIAEMTHRDLGRGRYMKHIDDHIKWLERYGWPPSCK